MFIAMNSFETFIKQIERQPRQINYNFQSQ